MKRFMKKTDITSLWEEDGDLKRMKAFFRTIQTASEDNDQVKQSIKQKALEKIANNEEQVGSPLIVNNGLVRRIRIRLRTLLGHRQWRLGIPVVGLALLMILIGQGVMNDTISFNPLSSMESKENLSKSMDQSTPSTDRVSGTESFGGASDGKLADREMTVPQSAYSDSNSFSSTNSKSASPTLPVPTDPAAVPPADAGIPRKMTQNLSLTLEVATINESVTLISKEVQQLGGYVTSSQQNGSDNHTSAQMTVKIPADKLNGLRNLLSTWGMVLDQNMIANDITNQYYDSQVRLKTLEAQEKRYLEILSQAKTVEDVLKVEAALGNIRQQVEQLMGQLKLWNNIVEYSTVTLQLVTLQSSDLTVKNPWQPISWSNTWKATQDAVLKTLSSSWNFLNYLVVGLGYSFPYLIIGALGWVAYRLWKKRNIG